MKRTQTAIMKKRGVKRNMPPLTPPVTRRSAQANMAHINQQQNGE